MTLTSLTTRNEYIGTGITGPYAYGFRIFAATDLLVTTRAATTGTETTLSYPSGYTVSGVGNRSGGSITLATALPTGDTLTIRRVLALTQTTSIRNQGPYFPATHEDVFDRLVMIDQQQQDEIERSIRLPETVDPDDVSVQLPVPSAGKALVWNDDADALDNRTLDNTTIALPGAGRTVATLTNYLGNNAIFNVKDYGAAGDGSTDDTAAFQAAVDAAIAAEGGIVLVPTVATSYYIAGTVTIGSPGKVIIEGWGQRHAQIKTGNNLTAVTFRVGVASGDYANDTQQAYSGVAPFVRFRRLWLEGPNGGSTGTALNSVGIEDFQNGSCLIEDCYITKYGHGYAGLAADIQSWRDTLFTFNGIGAALYSRSDQVDIYSPYFVQNAIGLLIESAFNTKVFGGVFVAQTTADIIVQQPSSSTVPPTDVATTKSPDIRKSGGLRVYGAWFESFVGTNTPRHIWLGKDGASGRFVGDIQIQGAKFICANTTNVIEVDAASDVKVMDCDMVDGLIPSGAFIQINSVSGVTQYVYDIDNRLPTASTRAAGTLTAYQEERRQVTGVLANMTKNNPGIMATWSVPTQPGVRWVTDGISAVAYQRNLGTEAVPNFSTALRLNWKNVEPGVNALTWQAAVALQANAGGLHTLTATTNIAATIGAPSNVPSAGQTARITIILKNSSGGALSTPLAFNAVFKLSGGAFTNPANGSSRGITFVYHQADGFWYEESRWAADA